MQVMAAGVNYNNVWACLGQPVSGLPLHGRRLPHRRLRRLGHRRRGGARRDALEARRRGRRPLQPELRRVPGVQRPRPDGLLAAEDLGLRVELGLVRRLLPGAGAAAAAEAGAPDLGGGRVATASSTSPPTGCSSTRPHSRPGDNVLVWGAGGGLGSFAIQLCRLYGANAIAVVSSRRQGRPRARAGRHRGDQPPRLRCSTTRTTGEPNLDEIKRFGKAIREATGGNDCDIVFEHVGSGDVLHQRVRLQARSARSSSAAPPPASRSTFDVRYLWMRQKTIIGSHFANAYQAYRANQLIDRAQDPARAVAHVPVRGVPGAAPDDARERAPREDGRARRRRGVSERAADDLGHRGPAGLRARRREGDLARHRRPRGVSRSRAASAPTCTAGARGRSASTPASARPRRPTSASGSCSRRASPALSIAFDLPTQMGLDSDDPRSLGEVGRVGVAIDSLDDMEALFDGIPLDAVSTSMTINAPAPVLVAMYVVAAEQQGVPRADRCAAPRRTTCSRSTSRAAPTSTRRGRRLRLAADLIAWCAREAPRFNAISLSGYHMREAGSTAVQEMAFALANAIAYVEAVRRARRRRRRRSPRGCRGSSTRT